MISKSKAYKQELVGQNTEKTEKQDTHFGVFNCKINCLIAFAFISSK